MMWNFQGQKVVVTGGTRGIGKGITEAFLQAGATVIATYYQNDQAARDLKEYYSEYSQKGLLDLYKFDIGNSQEVELFFKQIENKYDSIDVLINNSGLRKDNLLATMGDEEWHQVMQTNLTGTFYMCRKAVLLFLKNRYGRIINISSIGGRMGLQGQTNYAASKAGQVALTLSLSKEVAKKGITVNCLAPGFIDTDLLLDLDKDKRKEYEKSVPVKRFGKVSEVAHGVLFLASKESSYITGTTLEITGGL